MTVEQRDKAIRIVDDSAPLVSGWKRETPMSLVEVTEILLKHEYAEDEIKRILSEIIQDIEQEFLLY